MNCDEWAANWPEYGPETLNAIVEEYHRAEAHRKGLAEPLEDPKEAPWTKAWRIMLATVCVLAAIAVVGRALWWLGEYAFSLARIALGLWA